MSKSAKSTLLRKTLITSSVLGLIVLFFILNYFVIIPRQESSYNKKVFQILHEQSENLDAVINAHAVSYVRSLTNQDSDAAFQWRNDYTDKSKFIKSLKNSFKGKNTLFTKRNDEPVDIRTTLTRDLVVFKNYNKAGKVTKSFVVSIADIFDPIRAMHEDVFDYLMLIKKSTTKNTEDTLIYKSSGLDIDESKVNVDLINKENNYPFATVHDTTIEGAAYKLFVLPFRLGNQFLFFGGFIEEHHYKSNLAGSGYPMLLVIASLLIIVIISLPFLKIFFLGRKENLTIADIRLLITSFLAGPALFVLALATIQTHYYTDKRTDNFIDSIQGKIKNSFYKEISTGIQQLKYYDSCFDDPCLSRAYALYNRDCQYDSLFTLDKQKNHLPQNNKKKTKTDFKDSFFYPTIYKIFDWVSWSDSSGKNIAKWGLLDTSFHYLDLSERQYFKDIRDGNLESLPPSKSGSPDSFAIQPTLSWANGAYTINLAIPSKRVFTDNKRKADSAIMITLSSSMYSVYNPVMPRGYNFCIVNDTGAILFHSQTSRSLHENLFDETGANLDVRNAIIHKDSVLITGVMIYDHMVKMMITPIQGTHYYLATYYTEREQNLFVFHIAAFTLFAITTLLIILLFFLLSYFFGSHKLSSAFFTVHDSDWMAPSVFKNNYYRTLILFQLLLLSVLAIVFIFVSLVFDAQLHWYILQCSILLPFFAITGYYTIRRKSELGNRNMQKNKNGKMILYWYFFFLLIFFIFNFTQYDSSHRQVLKMVFDLGIMVVAACIPFLAGFACRLRPPVKDLSRGRNYLANYNTTIFLAILLISVIPTIGFFYYGFKKEELLRVRSRQIYLAEGIESKTAYVNADMKRRKINIAPGIFSDKDEEYFRTLKFNEDFGIYPANVKILDTAFTQSDADDSSDNKKKKTDKKSANTDLYQLVTKFLFLPPDHTDFFHNTNYYHWPENLTKSITLYYLNKNAGTSKRNTIMLTTASPRNAMLKELVKKPIGWLLLISFAVFLIIQYKLIIPIAKRVFLIGYFEETKLTDSDKHWVNNILGAVALNDDDGVFFDRSEKITYDYIVKKEEKQIHNGEQGAETILKIQNHLLPAYEEIWSKCSLVEKYILFDFATDGFTNYKNSDVLFSLYHRGLIRKDRETGRLMIMSYSFRNYLIAKAGSSEIQEFEETEGSGGIWKNLKTVVFVLIIIGIVYIFIAQEEIKNKLLIIIPGIVTLLPQVLKLFDKSYLGTKTEPPK